MKNRDLDIRCSIRQDFRITPYICYAYSSLFKVAPYSLTIALVLRTKAQVICARSKENVCVFRYFMTSTRAQKAKLTVNFLAVTSVKFRKICQTGGKYFPFVGTRFSGKSVTAVFSQR